MDNFGLFLVGAFSGLVAIAAVGFVAFRHPVNAALSFAVTVLAGSGLYLMLNAPYTAVANVIVYAGATIIIFLFALMYAQRSTPQVYDEKLANPWLSLVAALTLFGILAYVVTTSSVSPKALAENQKETPNAMATEAETTVANAPRLATHAPRVADLGREMYTKYLWSIELAGAILLVATLGAIHVARDDSKADSAMGSNLS